MKLKFLKSIPILFFSLFFISATFIEPLPTVQVPRKPFSKKKAAYQYPFPGWLAFGTVQSRRNKLNQKYSWSPRSPKRFPEIRSVIFCDKLTDCKDWEKTKRSQRFMALSPSGEKTELKTFRISEEKYGCKENRVDQVLFASVPPKSRFAEGPVWIYPIEQEGLFSAAKILNLSSDKTKAIWEIQTSNGSRIPIHLSRLNEKYGVPHPIAAFQYRSDKIVLVAWAQGDEEDSFPFFLIEKGKSTPLGTKYLYQCSY